MQQMHEQVQQALANSWASGKCMHDPPPQFNPCAPLPHQEVEEGNAAYNTHDRPCEVVRRSKQGRLLLLLLLLLLLVMRAPVIKQGVCDGACTHCYCSPGHDRVHQAAYCRLTNHTPLPVPDAALRGAVVWGCCGDMGLEGSPGCKLEQLEGPFTCCDH
jgi:hypothetical protein